MDGVDKKGGGREFGRLQSRGSEKLRRGTLKKERGGGVGGEEARGGIRLYRYGWDSADTGGRLDEIRAAFLEIRGIRVLRWNGEEFVCIVQERGILEQMGVSVSLTRCAIIF